MSVLLAVFIALQSSEVRQIVSFRFLPGKTAEAIQVFRDEARPLYEANAPMLRMAALCRGASHGAFRKRDRRVDRGVERGYPRTGS